MIPADTWEAGVEKVREAINKTTNPVMARLRLWYEMQQGDNLDAWINEIMKLSEQITWDGNDWKQAALDAICFQTSDSQCPVISMSNLSPKYGLLAKAYRWRHMYQNW